MIAELFSIVAPVFICVGLGFLWVRMGVAYDTHLISLLVINVGAPCLVFSGLTHLDSSATLFGTMVLAAILLMGATLLINIIVLKLMGRPMLPLAHTLTFSNWGNLSLPLSLFAFGKEGLGLALGFFVVASSIQNTVGMMFLSGRFTPREFLRLPVLYAVPVALVFMFTGMEPPKWVANTTGLLGGIMIPLMLISMGAALATLRVTHMQTAIIPAVYRMALCLTLGFVITWALGLEGTARGVVLLAAAMPSAILNYLYASRFQQSPSRVASIVFLSTLMSMVVIVPLLLAYLL